MASAIHHGPPGSFKSFTLVQKFVIEALQAGRVVITNIRGLTSIDRIQDQFPDMKFPDSAELLFVNCDDKAGRAYMAGWFHWVPFGALVIIDECQRVYPKRRDFKLEALDKKICPPGYVVQDLAIEIHDQYTEKTYTVHRPANIADAFDMQRHFNWDCYISTPHINKVIDGVREVCQAAYRHVSLGEKLPILFKGTWYEFKHHPGDSGLSVSHIAGKPRKYKADPRIYQCYLSTATGEHVESKADQNILGDPKLRFLAFVLFCTFLAVGRSLYMRSANASTDSSVVDPGQALDSQSVAIGQLPVLPSSNNVAVHVSNIQTSSFVHRLSGLSIAYHKNNIDSEMTFNYWDGKELSAVSYSELVAAGIKLSVKSLCSLVLMTTDNRIVKVNCKSPPGVKCGVTVKTPDFIINRDCHSLSDIQLAKNSPVPVQVQPLITKPFS